MEFLKIEGLMGNDLLINLSKVILISDQSPKRMADGELHELTLIEVEGKTDPYATYMCCKDLLENIVDTNNATKYA